MSAASSVLPNELEQKIREHVETTPTYDIHTHLYDPALESLLLWGIDEQLTYHYLVAEAFRSIQLPYEKYWALKKSEQAELVWRTLFEQQSPLSEATRGVVTTLHALGLDPKKDGLPKIRRWFSEQKLGAFVTRVMELAHVHTFCMTNSPFDPEERPLWEMGFQRDPRFTAALRIDPLLIDWQGASKTLTEQGYAVNPTLDQKSLSEVRRFLADWSKKLNAKYVMVSLEPDFVYPAKSDIATLIDGAVLPHCLEHGLPFALMPGVVRQVNPALRLAGDGVGRADLSAYQNLIAAHPHHKFLVTALSRENQHELCVLARKFRNLHVFGCWWFTNIPTAINDMTRMRLELLGPSFTPQHSDARVLDQVIYKWRHSRQILGDVLVEKYSDLFRVGWAVTDTELERDLRQLFGGSFETFLGANF